MAAERLRVSWWIQTCKGIGLSEMNSCSSQRAVQLRVHAAMRALLWTDRTPRFSRMQWSHRVPVVPVPALISRWCDDAVSGHCVCVPGSIGEARHLALPYASPAYRLSTAAGPPMCMSALRVPFVW